MNIPLAIISTVLGLALAALAIMLGLAAINAAADEKHSMVFACAMFAFLAGLGALSIAKIGGGS